MDFPRLDLLIYAHDGRGLGHVSRSIAIGMACRRLFPDLKILLVSGSKAISGLIGPAPLDWIKLPAYETSVIQGTSQGRSGPSNIADADLGRFRTRMLSQLTDLYRPRCVLSDHLPQGKHKELRNAVTASSGKGIKWVLGVRGVVGEVPGLWSDPAVALFREHYEAMFWYGDTRVLGRGPMESLQERFGTTPMETGYVSRLAEIMHWQTVAPKSDRHPAVTVSIPWIGENTLALLQHLALAIGRIGDSFGDFHLYIGFNKALEPRRIVHDWFQALPFCRIFPAGEAYFESLRHSKAALIYGGYNSLTDVLFAAVPAVVILRGMRDDEQESHLRELNRHGAGFISLPEGKTGDRELAAALITQLNAGHSTNPGISFQGAETAARTLARLMATTPASNSL